MHDPMAVAGEIKIGGLVLFTIWHRDPETDGSDDSCGWFGPKITKREEDIIGDLVNWDMEMPYLSSPYLPATIVDPKYDYSEMLAGDCLSFCAWAWSRMAWNRDKRSKLTIGEWWSVVNLSSDPHDNLRSILTTPDVNAEYKVRRFLYCVMKAYTRYHRAWWMHPKWHIHHWRIQFHFGQTLRRWLFSRCARCEKRFAWRYYPISSGEHTRKRRWFEGEQNCYHRGCYNK